MARRSFSKCFSCNGRFITQNLTWCDGDNSENIRQIAESRRLSQGIVSASNVVRLCVNCNKSIRDEMQLLERDPSYLRLNVVVQTHNHSCIICLADNNLHRLSIQCRVNVFISVNIFMPDNTRSCAVHLDDSGCFVQSLLLGLRFVNRPFVIKGEELSAFLQGLRTAAQTPRIIDIETITEADFKILAPVSKEQFDDLFSYCGPVNVGNMTRYITKNDLLMFLLKLRQGLSDDFLKVIFQQSSRQAVSLAISLVRQSLEKRFVP